MENWKKELSDFLLNRGYTNKKENEERISDLSENIVLPALKEIKTYFGEYGIECLIDKYLVSRFSHNITINNPFYVIFFYEVQIDPDTEEILCFWSSKANLKENYGNFLLNDKADTLVNLKDLSIKFDSITREKLIEHFVESFRINCMPK